MTEGQKLLDLLHRALPQTQCTKCGYPDCRAYAEALANHSALHNQCPPGGAEGIQRLGKILGRAELSLNPANGIERPRPIAWINPKECIGCTLCIQACPVDAIVGASKQMHVVIEDWCTGCDLCVPPCPVDCITMKPVTGTQTGWDAWNSAQAEASLARYELRKERLIREETDNQARLAKKAQAKLKELSVDQDDPTTKAEAERKRAIIAAAIARAQTQLKKDPPQ